MATTSKRDFDLAVWQAVRQIPKGRVTTYMAVAKALGKPKAARAVGNALGRNPFAPRLPCHRVVKSDGRLGGYSRGSGKKIKLLQLEGIFIKNKKIIRFNEIFFKF